MKISTKGRYALRMLLDLAEHQQCGYIALKDIAERQNISKKYLEQFRHFENEPRRSRRVSACEKSRPIHTRGNPPAH